VVVRTWNLFHGNATPPERHAYLVEMLALASADDPAIVCLQELPVWSLDRLAGWSGMIATDDVAVRPLLGSSEAALEIERAITALDSGRFRSLLTGQANAILVSPSLPVLDHRMIVLNPLGFRRREARRLGLGAIQVLAWGKNRRVCQAVRIQHAGRTVLVANLHATAAADKRLADGELLRAATFVDGFAHPGEPVVLAGDFNLSVENSRVLGELTTSEWGFVGPTPTGIDHVLVRGLAAGSPSRWPVERRIVAGRVLSDHAPVEREVV
jgi:endonuclease/exonuclease/phosphatase family metal-dependent hydrolase